MSAEPSEYAWVAEMMPRTVPWVGTARLEFREVSADRVVVALPDTPPTHNHVGGPHAAMIFGLGETASGALTLAAYSDTLAAAVPLVVRAEIAYRKLARGPLTAEARMRRPVAEVLAELGDGQRPEFAVDVDIRNADGVTTAELAVVWTLRPNR
jgi:acyl-coenzyme A thioesterase PaaI-like protein